jgi:hypothetical protein
MGTTVSQVNELTHQPVGGRKRGGGVRIGEMERDSMLAHGAAYMLNDRLMQCSDYSECYCCVRCGTLLAVQMSKVWLHGLFCLVVLLRCRVLCLLPSFMVACRFCFVPQIALLGSQHPRLSLLCRWGEWAARSAAASGCGRP